MKERLTTNQRIAINAIKQQSSITVILDTGERLIFTGKRICHEIVIALQSECLRRNRDSLKKQEILI